MEARVFRVRFKKRKAGKVVMKQLANPNMRVKPKTEPKERKREEVEFVPCGSFKQRYDSRGLPVPRHYPCGLPMPRYDKLGFRNW